MIRNWLVAFLLLGLAEGGAMMEAAISYVDARLRSLKITVPSP